MNPSESSVACASPLEHRGSDPVNDISLAHNTNSYGCAPGVRDVLARLAHAELHRYPRSFYDDRPGPLVERVACDFAVDPALVALQTPSGPILAFSLYSCGVPVMVKLGGPLLTLSLYSWCVTTCKAMVKLGVAVRTHAPGISVGLEISKTVAGGEIHAAMQELLLKAILFPMQALQDQKTLWSTQRRQLGHLTLTGKWQMLTLIPLVPLVPSTTAGNHEEATERTLGVVLLKV